MQNAEACVARNPHTLALLQNIRGGGSAVHILGRASVDSGPLKNAPDSIGDCHIHVERHLVNGADIFRK